MSKSVRKDVLIAAAHSNYQLINMITSLCLSPSFILFAHKLIVGCLEQKRFSYYYCGRNCWTFMDIDGGESSVAGR